MVTRRELALCAAGLCLGLLAGWLLGRNEPLLRSEGAWEVARGTREPVWILVVGGVRDVAAVRAAVAQDRIVASAPDGFAVRDGRVIVASLEGAGDLLMEAGWRDAELEIVDVRRASDRGEDTEAPIARMTELMNKPRLTLAEARLALGLL